MSDSHFPLDGFSWRLAILLCGVLLLGGCASNPDQGLTLQSIKQGKAFDPRFAAAYCARESGGDMDIVLLDRAVAPAGGGRDRAPVRQVMYIRVLWNPMHDMKADHLSASNATVHWYVMGDAAATSCDILEYAGTAFVALEPADGGTDLTIRDASLRPVACRGNLCDPVGACTIHGTIRAIESGSRVREALSKVRTAVAEANNSIPVHAAARPKPESPSSLAR